MKQLYFILISLFVIGCGNVNLKKETKKNANNAIIEEGMMQNGVRNGTWATYHDGSRKGVVKTSSSYCNGVLNGPYYEFDQSGRMGSKAFYVNGLLEGYRAKYKFGKAVEEGEYTKGQLNGSFKTYFDDFTLKQEAEFVNGKQHGRSLYYNQEGKIIMDYQYENGEKVSGGIVE